MEEVRARLPQVTALRLPEEGDLAAFLEHLWVLDVDGGLREDARRTSMYREQLQRDAYRGEHDDFMAFIHGLQLQIDIEPLNDDDLARAASLTNRTNQFNFTTIRQSEAQETGQGLAPTPRAEAAAAVALHSEQQAKAAEPDAKPSDQDPTPEVAHRIEAGLISRPGLLTAMAGATRRRCRGSTCHLLNFARGAHADTIYNHDNMSYEAHDRMGEFLGPVPTCIWDHVRSIVLNGVVVKYRSDDPCYEAFPDNYFEAAGSIQVPILLTSGSENRTWPESCKISLEMLREVHPHLDVLHEEVPGHGHFDQIFGKHAALDAFPIISRFLHEQRD